VAGKTVSFNRRDDGLASLASFWMLWQPSALPSKADIRSSPAGRAPRGRQEYPKSIFDPAQGVDAASGV
jgi:hypothetical protein